MSSCLDRALSIADDDQMADVWYNIGHIGISLGDLGLAYQVRLHLFITRYPFDGVVHGRRLKWLCLWTRNTEKLLIILLFWK